MSEVGLLDIMGCADRHQPIPVRPNDDHYRSPPECGRALASVVDLSAGVHECCAGDGIMAAAIAEEIGAEAVTATTLYDPGRTYFPVEDGVDFLTETRLRRPNIVTNPPYSKMGGRKLPKAGAATAIISHALQLLEETGEEAGSLCCLLDLRFRLSEERNRPGGLLHEFPPTRIHAFQDRVTMYPPLAGRGAVVGGVIPFAWFIWQWPFRRPGGISILLADLYSRAYRCDDDRERFDLPTIRGKRCKT